MSYLQAVDCPNSDLSLVIGEDDGTLYLYSCQRQTRRDLRILTALNLKHSFPHVPPDTFVIEWHRQEGSVKNLNQELVRCTSAGHLIWQLKNEGQYEMIQSSLVYSKSFGALL